MMQQQMLQMAQVIDAQNGTNMAEQMAAGITGGAVPAQTMAAEAPKIDNTEALGGDATGEAAKTKKAIVQLTADSADIEIFAGL